MLAKEVSRKLHENRSNPSGESYSRGLERL